MKLDELTERLTRCGLDEKEARTFVHLASLGATKVTDLARAAGLRRAEAYLVLDRLQSRGLVEATLTRPRMYTPVDPERALHVLEAERERELKLVQRMRGDLLEDLKRLGRETAAPTPEGAFRILHDQNQIRGQVQRTVARAEREVVIVTSARGLSRLLLEGLGEDLAATRGRGTRVRILTEITPGHEDLADQGDGVEVRHLMIPRPLRFLLADDREIVQYVSADPLQGGKETALWIGAGDYVQAQRAFFDDLWKGAIPAGDRLDQIRTGRSPEQAALVRGRFTRYEKQKDMVLRAERSVDVILPPDEAGRLAKSGLERILGERARDGVRVRILHAAGAPPRVPGAEARAHPLAEGGFTCTITDEGEVLLVFAGKDPGKSVTALDEAAAWVTMRGTAAAYQGLFERLWEAGAEEA